MDYGQNTPNMMGQTTNDRENNLDLSNQAMDWNLPMPTRDPRSIGNKTAIASAESLKPGAEAPRPVEVETSPELNEESINAIATAIENPTPNSTPEKPQTLKPQATDLETAVGTLHQAEAMLDQSGDIATFYDTVRNQSIKENGE